MTQGPNNTRTRSKSLLYMALWMVFVATLVVGADDLLGFVDDTNQLRETSRLFREEVAPLKIHTLNLVPNLKHTYIDAERPRDERLVPEGAARTFRTDAMGVVLNENRSEVEAKTRKLLASKTILFLGGSTTECNEVDEQFRFPAVVETLLRAAGANVRVENGGVRGHTSQDSINALLNRSDFRNADIIVLMQNINDRARLASGLGYTVQLGTVARTTTEAVEMSFRLLCSSIWDWISYRSNIAFVAREAVFRLDPWTGKKSIVIDSKTIDLYDSNMEAHLTDFENNLKVFVSVVRILGKTPVLMTQPLGADSKGERLFNAVIHRVAANETVQLIDLEDGLGSHPQWAFLQDKIHLNNVGSAAVGALIACRLHRTLIQTGKSINLNVLFSENPPFTLEDCSVHLSAPEPSKENDRLFYRWTELGRSTIFLDLCCKESQ
jgi:hypothetical protein